MKVGLELWTQRTLGQHLPMIRWDLLIIRDHIGYKETGSATATNASQTHQVYCAHALEASPLPHWKW